MSQILNEQSVEPAARWPIVELLLLAAPTIAQMASYTVMQFIDTWMLAHVGDGVAQPTAAANSGMFAFAIISMGMGVAIARKALITDELERGALIVPFGSPIAARKKYVIAYRDGALNTPARRAVHDWLVGQAAKG